MELSSQFVTNPGVLQEQGTGLRGQMCHLWVLFREFAPGSGHGSVASQSVGDLGAAKFRVIPTLCPLVCWIKLTKSNQTQPIKLGAKQ